MKKRIIAIFLTFQLIFSSVFMLANADNEKLGDVNNDGKVESLEQIRNYFIEVDAKAVIVPVSGYATLTNNMTINNVDYK